MLELLALLALAPLMLLAERVQTFQRLNPVEQNLQRASHGAAFVGLVLLVGTGLYSASDITGIVRSAARDPADNWPVLLLVVFFAYGLVRFLAGVRRSWGIRDGLLASRAVVKIAVGVAVVVIVWNPPVWFPLDAQAWVYALRVAGAPYSDLAIEAVVLWCVVTGVVRLVLTISGGFRFRRRVPRPVPMPHGESRLAEPGEGQRAMQGQSQISRMDGRKF